MEKIIEIKNVSMKFNLSKEKIDSLKEYVIKVIKRQLFYEEFWALNDVSLSINKGDIVGIVGLNGSGKSTLLKIIAGILKPTKGFVKVSGKISPLIELGAGFDYDLTARENIYLNGSVLGFTRKQMNEKFNSIVEFSELVDFLDVPLKNFSSGMVARLGFSVATTTKPDILIVDEILSVGDFLFQQKCERKINEMMDGGTTVLIVSHTLDQIRRLCNKVIWLEHGKIKSIGETELICNHYKENSVS